ncbi:MAG: DASS family sodium-coupled anion symporter [Deltaproteobacteria bacterium]|nr:DASS family sodium-coupled anion symporter [Deltaproteobacteria bacterium]MBW2051046.1 DASS family sodium-coupled anion symporter [Deltaproteobacteria bacterium]MBW2140963.1 DASS family sodium-coupled anion symporter [Deltaproteobacteria bacterium]MBW2324628.1 DASS family sodium-coupled anion symporter [Deltaproteobacteria bacterium]
MSDDSKKATGYDKFINWKTFIIPLGLMIVLLFIPTPKSMLDVGVEYSIGPQYVQELFSKELFSSPAEELSQWQILMIRMMETSINKSSFSQKNFLARDEKWCEKNNIVSSKKHLAQVKEFTKKIPPEKFQELLKRGQALKIDELNYEQLSNSEKKTAAKAGFHVKASVAIVLFVVLCFLTEAMPLPMVAFCIGVIALITGIVDRHSVASLYWSDATWFIMGSLMFATAFVKTGLDRRLAMMMFGRLKNTDIKRITLVIILIIAPLTMFMSDHALAAMFLPIGILLYSTSTAMAGRDDPELGKILMITIAMACNLGGSLAPSGAARNIIMMGYAEDMFGISIGFGQWILYCAPYLLLVVPITWFVINWQFKPTIKDMAEPISIVKEEIVRSGGKWTRQQIISLIIFLAMLFCWITEKNLILNLTGIRFGIGVFAVMGAIAYVFAGIVNWRDYQTRVDWGVVWLYAGAIIFGKVLVKTGGAYWLARSVLELTGPLGLDQGVGLLLSGNAITAFMTQLMADGPACAAVGPVTLAMAGIAHPGSTMIPFVAMSTAMASSLAYCLVIGTPPNAIVYASGYLEPKDFLRAGVILLFTNLGVLMLLSCTYWRWMGWTDLVPF